MTCTLAPYATDWRASRGRLHQEIDSALRTPFQRDRDRILHCRAFRRLMHKTQVFIDPQGDHVRTRLTHSLEVAQIARVIARSLQVDEDLTEAIALAHDLGHPPFGHAGEAALNQAVQPFGGFDHNDQALRILTRLERCYPAFNGLNLSLETLEGVAKHNGPFPRPDAAPPVIAALDQEGGLDLTLWPGVEAQIAALADDIAYNHHDLDDGLRAGLFSAEDLIQAVPHAGAVFRRIQREWPDLALALQQAEAVRRMIGDMVTATITEARARLTGLSSAAAVRNAGTGVVALPDAMGHNAQTLKTFLRQRMYDAVSVGAERQRAGAVMRGLFEHYRTTPASLPDFWRAQHQAAVGDIAQARIVVDYIAGMTDRFALRQAQQRLNLTVSPILP